MVRVDPNNNWAVFGDYVRKYDDWSETLVGKQITLSNRRSALVDAVYRDDGHRTWKVRARFEDGKSETIEKKEWASFDECVTFPRDVEIRHLAEEYAKRKEKVRQQQKQKDPLPDIATAREHEEMFRKTHDYWELTRASAAWRKANHPEEAVRVTTLERYPRGKVYAALLTTRAAALCDLGEWERAKDTIQDALEQSNTTSYPFMVRARICAVWLRDADQTHEALMEAKKRGAGDTWRNNRLTGFIKLIDEKRERIQFASELARKDPELYGSLKKVY